MNRKKIQRLMHKMGIEGMSPKRRTTLRAEGHQIYPYLLRNLEINRPNQVWCCDITYIPLSLGFLYLVAVMDWFSRYVLSWRLSISRSTHQEPIVEMGWRATSISTITNVLINR